MRKLSSADRSALIKLASSLPSGSPERKAILAGLQGSSKKASGDVNISGKHITAAGYTYTPNELPVSEINPSKIPSRTAREYQKRLLVDLKRKFPYNEIRLDMLGFITGSPFTYIKFNGLGTRLDLGMWFDQKPQDVWVLRLHISWGSHYESGNYKAIDIPWAGDLDAIYAKVKKASVTLVELGLSKIEEAKARP